MNATQTTETAMNTAEMTQIAVEFFFSAHENLGTPLLHPEMINGETWFAGRVVLGAGSSSQFRIFWAHADKGVIMGGKGLISEDIQDGLRCLAWDYALEDAELRNAELVLVRK
jgi:hypothetical protein